VTDDDRRPEDTHRPDEQPDSPNDSLLTQLERLFEAPIGDTDMAVRFDPNPETP
jgi:hypothetical protein